jgi:hypothetical protein
MTVKDEFSRCVSDFCVRYLRNTSTPRRFDHFSTPVYIYQIIVGGRLAVILTPWNWVLTQKLLVAHLFKNFSTFYDTWRFLIMFTRALHWSLSWSRWIEPVPPHRLSVRPILILSFCHIMLMQIQDPFWWKNIHNCLKTKCSLICQDFEG